MKQLILPAVFVSICLSVGVRAAAQEVPVIIKAKTVMQFPDNGDAQANTLPSETNTTIYVKGDHIKVQSISDQSHNYTYVDKAEKKTTMLIESNGRKVGYYSLDTAAAANRRPQGQGGDTTQRRRPSSNIEYSDETKTIAGFVCKKAVVTSTFGARTTTTTVWYTEDMPLKEPLPTAGFGGRGGGSMGPLGQIKGFPMAYETSMPNGFSMKYEVTKVEKDAKIDDKEFEIPKGFDIKPMSEMRNDFGRRGGFGGGMRNGGGGNGNDN